MGLQRSSSRHRKSSSFDIRNFSFMRSSRGKSQQHISGKPVEHNYLKRNSANHRDPLSIQLKQESKRKDSVPAWLRDSYNKRRNRSASEPEVSAPGESSTKVAANWRDVAKWPSQKLCSSESKIDCLAKKAVPPKNETVRPKYVDKSCSPILQLVARSHPVAVKVEKKLEGIRECDMSNNRRLLPKIEESATVGATSSKNLSDDEKTREKPCQQILERSAAAAWNTTKCGNCGKIIELGEIAEQAVQAVCKKYPHLVDVADSVRPFIRVPTPVVNMIQNEIVPVLQKRNSDAEERSRFKLIDPQRPTPSTNKSYSMDSSENAIRVRRAFPFGVIRKIVSPKNPMKGILPTANPKIKPPPQDWVSPLPHTPGIRSPQRIPTSARSPISSSPNIAPSKIKPSTTPIEVEGLPMRATPQPATTASKVVPPMAPFRWQNVPNKCEEGNKKIMEGEAKNAEQKKGRSKCEEWYEKIADVDKCEEWYKKIADVDKDKARENARGVESRAQKCLQSRAAQERSEDENRTSATFTCTENEGKRKYPSQKSTSPRVLPPANSPPHRTKSTEKYPSQKSTSPRILPPAKSPLRRMKSSEKYSTHKSTSPGMLAPAKNPSSRTKSPEKYTSRKLSSSKMLLPAKIAPHPTTSAEGKMEEVYLSGKRSTTEENRRPMAMACPLPQSTHQSGRNSISRSPIEGRRTLDSVKSSSMNAATVVQEAPFSQQTPASTTKINQPLQPLTVQSSTKHSPVTIEGPERGEGIIAKVEQKPACDLTNERGGQMYLRGNLRRRMSSLTERRLAAETPAAVLRKSFPLTESGMQSQSVTSRTQIYPTRPRLRKTAPTKVIPQSYCRVSMQRDARDQIRIYKEQNGIAHPLNPFVWFRRRNEKTDDGQQTLVVKTAKPFVSAAAAVSGKGLEKVTGQHPVPQWSGSSLVSPSVVQTWSVLTTTGELQPSLHKVGNSAGGLICAKPKLSDWRVARGRTMMTMTTRAHMFRSQFIQKKIHLVNNYNDSWYKNFNSHSLPLTSVQEGGQVTA